MSFSDDSEILPEYDFSRARSNKYASRSAEVRSGPLLPAKVLKASGLVGCGKAAPGLSESYKEEVKRRVKAKHGHR